MSFASSVKDEIALSDIAYEKDALTGLFRTAGSIILSNRKMFIDFKSENSKIAQMVYKKISHLYGVKPVTSIYRSMKLNKSTYYCLRIEDKVNEILEDLDLINAENFKNIVRSDKRINSFLAGCFLASGSVNDPKTTNYHLEFAFFDENLAKSVVRLIEKIPLTSKMIKRRTMYIVYIKRAQDIADLIAKMGAVNCYLEFEDYRMERDFYNSDNRINNCDIANAVRTNLAANEQIRDIKVIESKLGLDSLDEELKILAKLRLENPEDSLRKLAIKYNEITEKNYTKSGINHLFIKIKNIANCYRDKG